MEADAAAERDAAEYPEGEEFPERPKNVPTSGPGIYRAEFCFTSHLHPGAKRKNARCRWCNKKFNAGPKNTVLQNHLLACPKIPLAKKDAMRLALASVAAAPDAAAAAAAVPHAGAAAAAEAPAAAGEGQPRTGFFNKRGMLDAQARSDAADAIAGKHKGKGKRGLGAADSEQSTITSAGSGFKVRAKALSLPDQEVVHYMLLRWVVMSGLSYNAFDSSWFKEWVHWATGGRYQPPSK